MLPVKAQQLCYTHALDIVVGKVGEFSKALIDCLNGLVVINHHNALGCCKGNFLGYCGVVRHDHHGANGQRC